MMDSDTLKSPSAASAPSAAAWFRRSWKILLGASMGTLIFNILCLPLWTDYDVIGFFCTPFNKDAHVEIIYSGPLTGAAAFSVTASEPSLGTFSNCRYAPGVQLCTVHLRVAEEWKSCRLKLEAHRKGDIQIRLRGPYKRNDYGEVYSIATDYKQLEIGDKEFLSDRRKVTYARDFSCRIPVNANDTVKISFDVRRHHFDADDFNMIMKQNFWYVITLSILSFVTFHILLQCLVTSYKQGKAENAVFVCIFSLLLVVPLSNISDAPKSVREMRILKQRPKVSLTLKGGARLGREYDDWFCDHLGGREWLIKLYDIIQRKTQTIIRRPIAWYMQKNGWVFDCLRWKCLSSKDLNTIVQTLVELKRFCEMNQIKLYVFVVPRKESIYYEQLCGYGMDKQRRAEQKSHEQIKRLAAKQHVTYIVPWAELRDARKKDYVFFKLAHHWTDWGAYIGYCALMKEIRRDFPDIPVVSLGDYHQTQSSFIRDEWDRNFHTGNLNQFFGFENDMRFSTTIYNYYEHKNADKLVLNIGKFTKDFRYGGGAYKIMVIGTSQNENLMNFLPYSAAQTKYIRLIAAPLPRAELWKIMKYYKRDMLSYKPDVLIFSIFGDVYNMSHIQDIFKQ